MFSFDPARHLYTVDGEPYIHTTSALSILDKSGLIYWASGMACGEFGWLNPKKNNSAKCQEAARKGLDKVRGMSLGEYMGHLNKAYRAHDTRKNEAKETGLDLHALLEEFISCRMDGHDPLLIDPSIKDFVDWADKNVKKFLFTELCCFTRILHIAGTADFGYEDMFGNLVLGDFKSSEAAYYNMYLQCGAYDLQLSENGGWTEDGQKIFTLPKPFDRYEIFCYRAGLGKPFVTRECNRLKRAFSYCANLYREKIWWENAIDKKESGIKVFRK